MSDGAGRWTPLLEGTDAAEACRIIEAILTALEGMSQERRDDARYDHAGAALLHGYLARAFPERAHMAQAEDELERAAASLGEIGHRPSLHGGFSGLAWTVEHLREGIPALDEHTNDGLDEGLLAFLGNDASGEDFDLINGLVGIGVYALERLPHRGGALCLDRLLDRLAGAAEVHADGTTWRTPPELVQAIKREDYPEGWYNLGLAHGPPGVIALLGQVRAVGVGGPRVAVLLEESVRWLLAQRQPADAGAAFATHLDPLRVTPPQKSRLAWCYGDVGIAVAILGAGLRTDRRDWVETALSIAVAATQRPLDDDAVRDVGICHGAAGLGHLFNRMYQATGDRRLQEAARLWFRRVVAMREEGRGLGGYLSWGPKPGAQSPGGPAVEKGWYEDPTFLTGVMGTALALLAAISPIEPSWDRSLLSNLPVRTA